MGLTKLIDMFITNEPCETTDPLAARYSKGKRSVLVGSKEQDAILGCSSSLDSNGRPSSYSVPGRGVIVISLLIGPEGRCSLSLFQGYILHRLGAY